MIDDLGEQPKPTQEGQPRERVIELNEWFTPFENYHDIPYEKKSDMGELKAVEFKLSHLGSFTITTAWDQDDSWRIDREDEDRYLLVLPTSERFIPTYAVKKEQEKLETKLLKFDGPFIAGGYFDQALLDQTDEEGYLPYVVEIELPSGQIVKGSLSLFDEEMISVGDEGYDLNGEKIWYEFLVPETENILNKVKMRIVPK